MALPKVVHSSRFTVHGIRKTVNCRHWRPGFTLIELLVTIAIIVLLVAAATASWNNAQQKGRDSRRKADLKAVQQALEIYFQTNGAYPRSNPIGVEIQCNVPPDAPTDVTIIPWGAEFSCDENGASPPPKVVYTQKLPQDPVGITSYIYNSSFPYNKYTLAADLENNNDPERVASCLLAHDFCVINP